MSESADLHCAEFPRYGQIHKLGVFTEGSLTQCTSTTFQKGPLSKHIQTKEVQILMQEENQSTKRKPTEASMDCMGPGVEPVLSSPHRRYATCFPICHVMIMSHI